MCCSLRLLSSAQNPAYEDICSKFFEHFVSITAAISGWSKAKDVVGPGADSFGGEGRSH